MKARNMTPCLVAMALVGVLSTDALAVIRVTIRPVTRQVASASDTAATLPTAQTQFVPGENFVAELWAQTTEVNGLSSVTVDLTFINTVVAAQTITPAALFNASGLSTGTINNPGGLVDDLGGSHAAASPPCSDQVGLSNWARVAIVDMQALANGTSVIQSADTASAILGTAICNEFGNVVPADIDFGQVTVTVADCFDNIDCDDALFCNGPETCVSNVCQAGTPPTLSDGVVCTDDTCDEVNNIVVNTPNDANCDNGLFCDGTETCDATLDCQAGTPPTLTDGVVCTDDTCDEVNNVVVNTPNDANCDNGLFCDGSETCDATLDCQAGTPPTLTDGVVCTDDTCDEVNNVVVNTPNDANCDNGLFCDGSETCDATLDCQAGSPPTLTDGVVCTDDTCDEVNDVVVNTPTDANCDNGLFCDGAETCDAMLDCQSGTPPTLTDGIVCTDDTCDEVNDVVLNTSNDANCDNGLFCDGAETCDATLDCQSGTPPTLSDGVVCTDDTCDEVNNIIVNTANDANCDNGLFCDGSETCDVTLDCQTGTPPTLTDGVACTDDTCDEVNDVVVNTPNDANCDNGLFCDGSETCDATLDCQIGAPVCTASCEHCDEVGATCDLCILDLDFNGVMGTGDFALFASCFGGCYLSTDPCAGSNFDGDGGVCVGTGDFSGFVGCFGQICADCGNCAGPTLLAGRGQVGATDDVAVTIKLVTLAAASADDVLPALPPSETFFRLNQRFFVEVWATRTDISTRDGLAAVFVDLMFDVDALKVDDVIVGRSMPTFAGGIVEADLGLVSQLGGCAKLSSPDLGADGMWVRVATLAVRGSAGGPLTLSAGPGDEVHGVSIVNELGDLDSYRVDFPEIVVDISRRPVVRKVPRRIGDDIGR